MISTLYVYILRTGDVIMYRYTVCYITVRCEGKSKEYRLAVERRLY